MQSPSTDLVANIPMRTAHVHKLPSELLRLIFLFSTKCPFAGVIPAHAVAVGLSHVCAYWRDVALSYQHLWSTMPDRPRTAKWTALCLSRCATGDIRFVVPSSMHWDSPACRQSIRLVIPHISRVTFCSLTVSVEHIDAQSSEVGHRLYADVLAALSSGTMSRLRHLEIRYGSNGTSPAGWTRPDLPLKMFQPPVNYPPRLSTLILEGCCLTNASALYTASLCRLSIRGVQAWIDLEEMDVCLRATRSLEYLSIDRGYNPVIRPVRSLASPSTNLVRSIHLPHLRELWLKGTLELVLAIYARIAVPATANVELDANAQLQRPSSGALAMDPVHGYVAAFKTALAGQFTSSAGAIIIHDVVDVSSGPNSSIRGSIATEEPDTDGSGAVFVLAYPDLFTRFEGMPSLLETCISLPTFYCATSARFGNCMGLLFHMLFGSFPRLSHLRLTAAGDVATFARTINRIPTGNTLPVVTCLHCNFTIQPAILEELIRVVDTRLPHTMLVLVRCQFPDDLLARGVSILGEERLVRRV